MKRTRLPASARPAPRLTAVVVLPTPPFWFIMAMMRGVVGPAEPVAGEGGWLWVRLSWALGGDGLVICDKRDASMRRGAGCGNPGCSGGSGRPGGACRQYNNGGAGRMEAGGGRG